MINRRDFVTGLAALTVGAGALAMPAGSLRDRLGRLLGPPRMDVRDLEPETFAGLAGTHLTIRGPGGAVRARLADVSGLDRFQKRSARRLKQMSLLFEVPKTARMEAGMHRVEHPLAGSCDLYLSEVGPAGRVRQFEAVISRLA